MAFVRTQLELHPSFQAQDGILSSEDLFLIKDAQRMVHIILEEAQATAQDIKDEAQQEAEQILGNAQDAAQQIQQDASSQLAAQLQSIDQEWQRAIQLIEPTVFALAGLAVSKICQDLTPAEKVASAVQSALKELPDSPLKLSMPPGLSNVPLPSSASSLQCLIDSQLEASAAMVEGESSICQAQFSIAQCIVIGVLETWIEQALNSIKASKEG